MLPECRFNARVKVDTVERLGNIVDGPRDPCPCHGIAIGESGYVHHGYVKSQTNLVGGLDAVPPTMEPDVHQDERRSSAFNTQERIFGVVDDPQDRIPGSLQYLFQIKGDDALSSTIRMPVFISGKVQV